MTSRSTEDAPRTIAARPRPIVRATELGAASVLKAGPLVLVSDAYGDIAPDRRGLGLYLGDTRVLSTMRLVVEGRTPTLLRGDPGGAAGGVVHLTNPDLPADPERALDLASALPRQSIGIRRDRRLHPSGSFVEELTVSNFTATPQHLRVRLVLDVDGADIFEVRGHERARRGSLEPAEIDGSLVRFRYLALDGRELVSDVALREPPDALEPARADEAGSVAAGWSLALAPGGRIRLGWEVKASWSEVDRAGADPATAIEATGLAPVGEADRRPDPFEAETVAIETDDELVNLILERAMADLRLLRTAGPGPGEHFVAAGIPWFATLFGRDSLVSAYAALPYFPGVARDALSVLARLQATEDDPERDAEPGKILHEMRTGEMARTGEIAFARYYGSVDSTPLWLILLAESHAWTGDGHLVDRLWPAALRALEWLDLAPRDGDGFLVYRRRAQNGLRNQGWKDSADAIRDRHGRLIEPPIALAEVQAYAVEARRRIADLARGRRETELAAGLEEAATAVAGRFDARFWQADVGRYAMALGPDDTVADAMASNVGHCLWAGIVPPHRAQLAADTLVSPPLFSGWGVRTFAADQPGFNPLGYHTGSVWPHDSAIAAAGLKRYGFHEQASKVAWAVLDAARRVPDHRLPELFCGFERDAEGTPVVHPVACAPQAWSAASALLLVTTMLGLVPHAPAGELEIVRPVLPPGLAKIVVRGLSVGPATVDLLFHRWRGTTSAEVIGRTGDVRVTVRL